MLSLVLAVVVCMACSSKAMANDDEGLEDSSHYNDRSHYAKNIEWFGMNLGFGMNFYKIEYSYYSDQEGNKIQKLPLAALSLFNLQYKHFHFTFLELDLVPLYGMLGGGIRGGGRIPITPNFQQEIRIGSFFGLEALSLIIPFDGVFAFRPYLQYVYNTRNGSWGFGLDLPINLFKHKNDIRDGDGHSAAAQLVSGGFLLYFHFKFGRTPF